MSVAKVLFGLLFAALLPACAKGEDPLCAERRQGARGAVSQGNLELATKLLDEARARCSPKLASDLRRIERSIREAAEAQQRAAVERAERAAERELPVGKSFVRWVIEAGTTPTKDPVNAQCAERGSADFGFCEATRPGSPEMRVRYWQTQRNAVRYSCVTAALLSCEDLGEHRRVRIWTRDEASYELCEPTEHALRGLTALLVRTRTENRMSIFTQAYVRKDPEFERLLAERR